MKKTLHLILITLFLCISSFTSAQQLTFSKVLYNFRQGGVQYPSVVPAFDEGYIIAGQADGLKGLILKIDTAGVPVWSKTIYTNTQGNISPDVTFNRIIPTVDSCYLIAGSIIDSVALHIDALCIKVSISGDTLWSRRISKSGYSLSVSSIVQTNDSGFAITGHASTLSLDYVFAAKLDATGHLQWINILNGADNSHRGNSIRQTPDSGYVMTGYIENYPPYDPNAYLAKLSSSGTVTWSNRYHLGQGNFCLANDVEVLNDGYLLYMNIHGNAALMKTDLSGTVLWIKEYGPYHADFFSNQPPQLRKTSDGGYVFTDGSCFGGALTKVDSSGTLAWHEELFIAAGDVIEAKDKGLLIVGSGPMCGVRLSSAFPSAQIGIIKTDSLGYNRTCIFPNTVDTTTEILTSQPVTFTSVTGATDSAVHPFVDLITLLEDSGCVDFGGGVKGTATGGNTVSVFPNPSNGVFTFRVSDKQSEVIIYNLLGEIIYQSVMADLTRSIDLSAQPDGIYFYRVQSTDQTVITGKLTMTN